VTLSRRVAVGVPTRSRCYTADGFFLSALLGATNPLASAPGTIRGDFAIDGESSRTPNRRDGENDER